MITDLSGKETPKFTLSSKYCPNSPADIIENNKNEALVKPENINKLLENICCIIEDENLRKNMGKYVKVNIKIFDQHCNAKIDRTF